MELTLNQLANRIAARIAFYEAARRWNTPATLRKLAAELDEMKAQYEELFHTACQG